ncbi:unnamed protein product, partial [Cylicocyclus nassatus]
MVLQIEQTEAVGQGAILEVGQGAYNTFSIKRSKISIFKSVDAAQIMVVVMGFTSRSHLVAQFTGNRKTETLD